MSIEIKKEDPLEYSDFPHNSLYNEFVDGEDSLDYEQNSSNSNQEYSLPEPSKSPKNRGRVSNPTPIEMPTKEEILIMTDLNWKIALQRHKTTQELGNDSRTKIAKLLIKNIYERKFQLHGNYDLKMTVQNFQQLSDTLVEIFPTEVVETYFNRSLKGKCATGKLYNAFVNTRAEIADSGLLQTSKRNMNKTDKVKDKKCHIQPYTPSPTVSKFPDAMNICQSTNFDNPQYLIEMWDSCFEHRQNILREKQSLSYFNMFPYLKESNGFQLLLNDAQRKFYYCGQIDRLELVASKIFERIQRMFKGESLPKNYLQNYQNSSTDPVILALILLPFLFTVVCKRASTGAPKVTKQEMYNRFFPHFTSLTELEDFENTQNFNEKPVQVCVIGNLKDRPYSIVRVYNTKYHFGSPREAMNVALRIFLALNLDFPYESTQMWVFLKKFVFRIEDESSAKIFPQVETMINEFNLYLRKTQNL